MSYEYINMLYRLYLKIKLNFNIIIFVLITIVLIERINIIINSNNYCYNI